MLTLNNVCVYVCMDVLVYMVVCIAWYMRLLSLGSITLVSGIKSLKHAALSPLGMTWGMIVDEVWIITVCNC